MVTLELAYNLGVTEADIRDEMTFSEFNRWMAYFEKRPVGWKEDLRTAYIMNSMGVEKSPSELFDSVKTVIGESKKDRSPMDSLQDSLMFQKMLSAKGGDKVNL
ncbi:hypothetical protein N9112_00135 [bacterium]|nr:hypothetical protein [bacterium]